MVSRRNHHVHGLTKLLFFGLHLRLRLNFLKRGHDGGLFRLWYNWLICDWRQLHALSLGSRFGATRRCNINIILFDSHIFEFLVAHDLEHEDLHLFLVDHSRLICIDFVKELDKHVLLEWCAHDAAEDALYENFGLVNIEVAALICIENRPYELYDGIDVSSDNQLLKVLSVPLDHHHVLFGLFFFEVFL